MRRDRPGDALAYRSDRESTCQFASPQIPQLGPTKYPRPAALVSPISCHLSQATAATP
jgi:hypothetical protein